MPDFLIFILGFIAGGLFMLVVMCLLQINDKNR